MYSEQLTVNAQMTVGTGFRQRPRPRSTIHPSVFSAFLGYVCIRSLHIYDNIKGP